MCGHQHLEWEQLSYIKKLKDLKHVNFKAKTAYRYCKSQIIAVCKGISILIIQLNEQTEPLKKKITNTTKVLLLPVQFTPFPEYPGLQVHIKDPLVFRQLAFASQLCFPAPHSFISAIKKSGAE